jgi:hypothetical protein
MRKLWAAGGQIGLAALAPNPLAPLLLGGAVLCLWLAIWADTNWSTPRRHLASAMVLIAAALLAWQLPKLAEAEKEALMADIVARIEKAWEKKGGPSAPPLVVSVSKRARMQIQGFELFPITSGAAAATNVLYKNVGDAQARTYVSYITTLLPHTDDGAEESKGEDAALGYLKQVMAGPVERSYDIGPSGKEIIWFTHTGMKLTEEQVRLVEGHRLRVYFLGAIKYTDEHGTRCTTYCQFTHGDPRVWFACQQYNATDAEDCYKKR